MLESILTLLSTLVGGGVLGMLFERKKRKVETDAIEAEVVDRIQIIYKKFLEDYNQKITDLLNENEKLKEKIRKIEERIKELSKLRILYYPFYWLSLYWAANRLHRRTKIMKKRN